MKGTRLRVANRERAERAQEVRRTDGEIAHELEKTEPPSVSVSQGRRQGAVQDVGGAAAAP